MRATTPAIAAVPLTARPFPASHLARLEGFDPGGPRSRVNTFRREVRGLAREVGLAAAAAPGARSLILKRGESNAARPGVRPVKPPSKCGGRSVLFRCTEDPTHAPVPMLVGCGGRGCMGHDCMRHVRRERARPAA